MSGMLRANGIEAHVGGYYLQGGVGDLAPINFANIMVEDSDYESAREIINEYEQARKDDSADTKSGQLSFTVIVIFVLISVAMFMIGLIKQ